MKKIRYIPYGYTIRNGRTIIEHTEADVIREIFTAYIGGASLKEIAECLTDRRVPYSERSEVWDKARIARIIDNAKYIGNEEYDPIIDEEQFETAGNLKVSRQRNTIEKNNAAIELLRDHIHCERCNSSMKRQYSGKHHIHESWTCVNGDCGLRVRISDTELLEKITILLNRIIQNSSLLIPQKQKRQEMSPLVLRLNNEISKELEHDDPREELIIAKTIDMASLLYKECNIKTSIAAAVAKKRAEMMTLQDHFNGIYFTDLIDHITLGEAARITLHTKTDTEIGDELNGSDQNT